MTLSNVLSDLELRREERINRLFNFLKIKSISTDPVYTNDCRKAALWLQKEIKKLGLNSEIYDEGIHPIVFCFPDAIDLKKPTYLFYGHYDVQPADP